MGQKVHPYGFRLGVNKPWRSRWFVERDYDKLLVEDVKLKRELKEKLKAAGVSSVEIERPGNKLRLIIRTARPGIIIGRKGAEIDKLKLELQLRTKRDVFIDILEVNKPELDAQLVAENIALQLEKRVGFRRAMRKAVDSALRFGCKGIKVRVSGRLNGNEIARCALTLTTVSPRRTPPTASSASRPGCIAATSTSSAGRHRRWLVPALPYSKFSRIRFAAQAAGDGS
jgi:small subunit ribosomal protein S3